jgi:hypothetical protein
MIIIWLTAFKKIDCENFVTDSLPNLHYYFLHLCFDND